jgi:hypothetical protein
MVLGITPLPEPGKLLPEGEVSRGATLARGAAGRDQRAHGAG